MTSARHYDAHCHWQSASLLPHSQQIARDLEAAGLAQAVVNGTCPADWQAVADLARADPRVLPAFGLHPWKVNAAFLPRAANTAQQARHTTCPAADTTHRPEPPANVFAAGALKQRELPPASALRVGATKQPPASQISNVTPACPTNGKAASEDSGWQWLDTLRSFLAQFPQAAVGEIGLDNWIEGADKALQQQAFLAQLALAATDNRPVSIHCLRADADLLAALRKAPALPARGIHLHGFAGSVETARQLLDMGAYFSFSEYIAEPKRTKARAVAAYIPLNRLLAETDAPDMTGPPDYQHHRLEGSTTQPPPKHPANITAAYACLADLRNLPLPELTTTIEANFLHYFRS